MPQAAQNGPAKVLTALFHFGQRQGSAVRSEEHGPAVRFRRMRGKQGSRKPCTVSDQSGLLTGQAEPGPVRQRLRERLHQAGEALRIGQHGFQTVGLVQGERVAGLPFQFAERRSAPESSPQTISQKADVGSFSATAAL